MTQNTYVTKGKEKFMVMEIQFNKEDTFSPKSILNWLPINNCKEWTSNLRDCNPTSSMIAIQHYFESSGGISVVQKPWKNFGNRMKFQPKRITAEIIWHWKIRQFYKELQIWYRDEWDPDSRYGRQIWQILLGSLKRDFINTHKYKSFE